MSEARATAERGDLAGAVSILENCRMVLSETVSAKSRDRLCVALDADLKEMQERMASRHVYEASGRAYILSGLSSHSWQRATARGDSTDGSSLVQAYQTPSMVEMLTRSQAMLLRSPLTQRPVQPLWSLGSRPRPRYVSRKKVRSKQKCRLYLSRLQKQSCIKNSFMNHPDPPSNDLPASFGIHKAMNVMQDDLPSGTYSFSMNNSVAHDVDLKDLKVCSLRKRSYDQLASESEYESDVSGNSESSPDGRRSRSGKSKSSLHRKKTRDMTTDQERSVLEEQQSRRMQEALASPEDSKLELKVMKAMGPMEEGDAVFGSAAEVSFDSSLVYWLHDKYRIRKPKYSNRVHTGYEWNKYNRSHYDHDHPPPKFVQGYKFNIFYPDLVDKTKAPVYTFDKDANSTETCIIRFHAGSPYQDIAFRVVNKEWEYSPKKGFKCIFERGILQLYFNFKRHPYRR